MKREIIKRKEPLTCRDTEAAVHFIGKECYFSDDLDNFKYLDGFKDKLVVDGDYSNMYKGKLLGIFANDNAFIVDENDIGSRFDYCLPCEWVQEIEKPKYRPYTLEEFKQRFNVGWTIKFRGKHGGTDYLLVFNGYVEYHDGDEPVIVLGPYGYTLRELFEDYEWIDSESEGYLPFGIKEYKNGTR